MIIIQIGKKGLTHKQHIEIKKNIDAKNEVKLNLLNSALYDKDRKEYYQDIKKLFPNIQTKLIGKTIKLKP